MQIFNSREQSALNWAKELHAKQPYGDLPYYEGHILPVVNLIHFMGGQEIHKIVGALHDSVEDGVATLAEIESRFDGLVAFHVHTLTRYKNIETYDAFIERVAGNPVATFVKLADLAKNMEACTQGGGKEALHERYRAAVQRLRFGK